MLGPASTAEDRPPINPAIRVYFPSEADDTSFAPWQKNEQLRFIELLPKETKAPSTGIKSGSSIFSLNEKGTYLQIGPMTWHLRGGMTSYIFYYAILQ